MRILRAYPPAWRARYGDELAALLEQLDGGRVSGRNRLDVIRSGIAERVRRLVRGGLPPGERAREGSLLVLHAWMLFTLGGFGVAKAAEHWQAVTPVAKRGLPAAAFDVVVAVAAIGSALVLLGVAVLLPRLTVLVRSGGWPRIERPIVRAVALSLLAAAATIALAAWARSLTPGARNGGDGLYGAAFAAWIVLFAACLLSWARAAAAAARRLVLPVELLRLEVRLAAAVSVAMVVMTAATGVWWGALAHAAPWFFAGRPVGAAASALTPNMIVPAALMLCASALGLLGATTALRALADS
jgi:hypothetical protein